MINYSNPRMNATIKNWPYGRLKTTCEFFTEIVKGKQRAVRITYNPKTGRSNKPKKLKYSARSLIVDGTMERFIS